jgi:hypothetical protein
MMGPTRIMSLPSARTAIQNSCRHRSPNQYDLLAKEEKKKSALMRSPSMFGMRSDEARREIM